jgi:hypothetical protein
MAHGRVQWQKIDFLGQARLESLATTYSNRVTLPAPDDR